MLDPDDDLLLETAHAEYGVALLRVFDNDATRLAGRDDLAPHQQEEHSRAVLLCARVLTLTEPPPEALGVRGRVLHPGKRLDVESPWVRLRLEAAADRLREALDDPEAPGGDDPDGARLALVVLLLTFRHLEEPGELDRRLDELGEQLILARNRSPALAVREGPLGSFAGDETEADRWAAAARLLARSVSAGGVRGPREPVDGGHTLLLTRRSGGYFLTRRPHLCLTWRVVRVTRRREARFEAQVEHERRFGGDFAAVTPTRGLDASAADVVRALR